MKLNELFENAPEIEIDQLSTDSRLPMKNAIFFCLDGIKYDGHKFIDEAIKNGAKVIVYSKELLSKSNAIFVKVKNVNDSLYRIADTFYDHPNKDIVKYLVSGCYGRSSVSTIIKYYLNKVENCGSVGIFGINYKDRHLSIAFPALTPLENLRVLDNFKNSNIKNAVFESSVISLFYKKLDVVKPEVFIYTNTSKYCSDYKVCNNSYFEYLRRYFYTLEDDTCVLLNTDDESYDELVESVNNYKTYGTSETADYRISNVSLIDRGTSFVLSHNNIDYKINTKLIGMVNVYNIVAAIAALNIRGYEIEDIISKIEDIPYIDGVMEIVDDEYRIIIDCGYEIDSVKNICEYASKTSKGRTIGVIGVNYTDSDQKIKRIMKICENYLDETILTEDESLQSEVMTILQRADQFTNTNNVLHIPYRSVAIENAINILNRNDTLLVLGKGNETYMNMGLGKERYLGDKHYINRYLNKRKDEEDETI